MPELREFKVVTTLIRKSEKIESDDATKYSTFYSNSKAKTIINESNIDDVFEPIYSTTNVKIRKSFGKSLCCIIDSVVDHTITIPKHSSLTGSTYINY